MNSSGFTPYLTSPSRALTATRRRDRLERADGYPPHIERYEAMGVDLASALSHMDELGVIANWQA